MYYLGSYMFPYFYLNKKQKTSSMAAGVAERPHLALHLLLCVLVALLELACRFAGRDGCANAEGVSFPKCCNATIPKEMLKSNYASSQLATLSAVCICQNSDIFVVL